MWPNEWWWPFHFMWIFPLIFFVVLLRLFSRRGGDGQDSSPSAREILDRRYARGEIGREEYRQMKNDLDQGRKHP